MLQLADANAKALLGGLWHRVAVCLSHCAYLGGYAQGLFAEDRATDEFWKLGRRLAYQGAPG